MAPKWFDNWTTWAGHVSLSGDEAIMASAERESVTGVQGPNPWSGQGRSPLKLKAF